MVFLGAANLPRLVLRRSIDPYGGPAPAATQVAITCLSTFTDTAQSASLEHHYEVITLSSRSKACGAASTDGEALTQISGVTFPATVAPAMAAPAASQSRLSATVSKATQGKPRASVTAAPGDGWPAVIFRYQAFIKEDKIWAPGFSGELSRIFKFYHGDARWYDPNGAYRYRFDARVTFGSLHSVTISKYMGTAYSYACKWPNGTDCLQKNSATAPLTQLNWINVAHGWTTADFTLTAAAKNPLESLAPAIDAGVAFHLRPGGTTINGIHDRMPVHEIYFYAEGWGEWATAYRSDAWNIACLAGRNAAPGCEARFSVLL